MIELDNIKISDGEIFGLIGKNYDDISLFLNKIAKSNICFIDRIKSSNFKVKTILKKNYKHEYVNFLDIDINKKVKSLNQGEIKKIIFLLTIFSNKSIIILDNPFLLIDNKYKDIMIDIIKKVNKTVIISVSNLDEINICNHIGIIVNGELKEYRDFQCSHVNINGDNIDKALLPLKNMKIDFFNRNEIDFIYMGDINELLKYLIKINLKSIKIGNMEIEDLYKYFYKN